MFKLTGAFCILAACGYIGLKMAGVYNKRVEVLRFIQNGLNLLETEINYGATPLPLALKRIGEKLNQRSAILFSQAAKELEKNKGIPASVAWEEGIYKLSEVIPLTTEEIHILTCFGKSLGSSDKEEQIKNIALAREQLKMVEKSASVAKEKNQRMWQYLGFCLGAVIVLILI